MTTRGAELADAFARASAALGIGDRALVEELARRAGWGDRDATAPLLPCGFRHGIPWGISVVAGAGAPELRVLVEAQADPPTHEGYAAAAERVTSFFAERGASLAPLAGIDLAGYRLWHAVAFGPTPAFRVYLCIPRGGDIADLGLDAPRVGTNTIVSFDLLDREPRTKVYALVPEASFDDLERLSALGEEHRPGDATLFARTMLGEERPIGWLVCFVYVGTRLRRVALHLHVPRHVPDGRLVAPRLESLFRSFAIDPAPYRRTAGDARHHFVTFQRAGGPRVTTYFLPTGAR